MEDEKLSIIDHLEEMRWRILKSLLAIGVLIPLSYWQSLPALIWLRDTFYKGADITLIYTQPMEGFFVRLKVSFILAIIVAYPVIAFQIWRFVAPGLFKQERYYLSRFVFVSTFLFAVGSAFALFGIYPLVLRFGQQTVGGLAEANLTITSIVGMASKLMLGFGVMFQLPILVYVLGVTEMVPLETMRKARPIIVVIVFTLSAILTPPDVISQLMMGVPALFLFEVSLVVSDRALRKKLKRRREEEAREAEEQARYEAERKARGETDDDDSDDDSPSGGEGAAAVSGAADFGSGESSSNYDYDESYYNYDYDYYANNASSTKSKEKPRRPNLRSVSPYLAKRKRFTPPTMRDRTRENRRGRKKKGE